MRTLGFQELGAVLNLGFWVPEYGKPMRVRESEKLYVEQQLPRLFSIYWDFLIDPCMFLNKFPNILTERVKMIVRVKMRSQQLTEGTRKS